MLTTFVAKQLFSNMVVYLRDLESSLNHSKSINSEITLLHIL